MIEYEIRTTATNKLIGVIIAPCWSDANDQATNACTNKDITITALRYTDNPEGIIIW